ncbi:hypothetical protein [Streptomyces sp. B6B3]|uniref:hypothetical protein n=1 Tax=Streptomyces sp. B6B3 TaxID=3153570 RepID=UPI00325D654F
MMRILGSLPGALRAFGYGIDAGHAIRHGRTPSAGASSATAPVGAPTGPDQPAPESHAGRPELRVVTGSPAVRG